MTAAAAHRLDGRDGFALIEVMLALMLIAVLAALALPGLVRATGPAALRVAAFQVSALLREDRNSALSSGRATTTRLGARGRSVVSDASSASVGMPAGAAAGVFGATTPGIRFFADGRSSGGEIVIASDTARYVVAVSPDTGAIRVGEP